MLRPTMTLACHTVGISGMSGCIPQFKVELEDWCDWTGNEWGKVKNVVGKSFRVPGPKENVYTLAAGAVLQLIKDHDLNPKDVGFLGLGTESSTDNSAGSVIVKGMVDMALKNMGNNSLPRSVEVPEFKHACLGGVYAMKAACRFVDTDLSNRKCIVVAADIAEYERGTTGEPTQGAGAVAMLIEKSPKILSLDYKHAGSSSTYRGPDFRKPVSRLFDPAWASATQRKCDFPVFSGPYSTAVYTDTTIDSVEQMLRNLGLEHHGAGNYFETLAGLFLHRPYHMMPVQAVSTLYVRGLVRSKSVERGIELEALCYKAKVVIDDLRKEIESEASDPYEEISKTGAPPVMHKLTGKVAKALRGEPGFKNLLAEKMAFGNTTTEQLGNLYTASLPAWIMAGMDDAAGNLSLDLSGSKMVAIGYGSGDASEAIPMTVQPEYRKYALRSNVSKLLSSPISLTKEQYEDIHDTRSLASYPRHTERGFFIETVGTRMEPAFQDLGVEYYGYAHC
eukprot:TRINITY_DN1814_c0_g1_i8.p1 TRINITY_DN1814_c0_g1~~TRINITY_DN1814_c0_g1_i8.p1  ORF type:complete len:527 (+),score=66.55 TRINITY_DN1814_c0_g1_i8:66-1583(+)